MSSIISIRNVTKRFPGVVALSDVTLHIEQGEVHAICGENGAGKSTLMKILSGVITAYEGEVDFHDEKVVFAGTRDAEAAGISIIHQELNLVEELSAAANIFLGREMCNALGLLDDRAMERAAQDLLGQLECEVESSQLAGSLRVGDQQLVEIAKALSFKTDILIMDEPTSALTESEVERLFRVIDRLKKQGVTILYISHKMDEIFALSDRITILRDGQLVATVDCDKTNAKEVTHQMVGRDLEETHLDKPRTPGDVVLKVADLSLPWPGHARGWRLQNIHFELRCGEVLGIAGLMGAGRTELLESLFGASHDRPIGEIFLKGKPVAFEHPSEAMRSGVALVTEDRKRFGLFAQMNVRQNISMCALEDKAAHAAIVDPHREQRLAFDTIDQFAIKSAGPDAAITSLSGGNQQKTIIGRWLLTDPTVLLLDDPTRGVDIGAKAELYRLIDTFCRKGLGVIVTSSELPELLALCDRILVLCEGRLTGEFTRADATEQGIMEAATMREETANV